MLMYMKPKHHVVGAATEHGRCGLSRMQKVRLYGMLECQLRCEFMLLLNIADVG